MTSAALKPKGDAAAAQPPPANPLVDAKTYLMTENSKGESVYQQLFALLHSVTETHNPAILDNPTQCVEAASELRRHAFHHGPTPATQAHRLPEPARVSQSERALQLFEQPTPQSVTKIERPRPGVTITTTTLVPIPCPKIRSLVEESSYWRECGVGLPPSEVFLLEQSIATLAMTHHLSEVQFFGRVHGTNKNYYVVVSRRHVPPGVKVYPEVHTMPRPPRKGVEVAMQPEPIWKGLNRYTFWVCTEVGGAWTALPDLTPQQLQLARGIRKFFTGELDASVVSYPPFPWSEAVYLRAQLARIWAGTIICPEGALVVPDPPEEDNEAEDDEASGSSRPSEAVYVPLTEPAKDWVPPEDGVHAMQGFENWVHATEHIFKMGRATKPPEKVASEDAEEEESVMEDESSAHPGLSEEPTPLFHAIKNDKLFGVVKLPKPLSNEGEEEDEEDGHGATEGDANEEAGDDEGKEQEGEEDGEPVAPADESDAELLVDDEEEDPLKEKQRAWSVLLKDNAMYKKHAILVLRSVRWPGAYAYAASGGRVWGCIYIGDGLKRTFHPFAPPRAPTLQKHSATLVEYVDPTAANEKLVLRGEEPRGANSEDEKEPEEEDE